MMKKKMLTVLVMVLCLLGSSALAADFGVVYRTDNLNLRGQGSASSEWLGTYPRGTWVEITGSQNNFYRVRTPDGRTGYMSKNYIEPVGSSNLVWLLEVTNPNGGAFLNFRAQPSYDSQVLDLFYNGVPLRAYALNGGWFTVEVNGQRGYVRCEYVMDHGTRYGSETVATIRTPNNGGLNLRSGPGMNYPVIDQFSGDRYVSVLAEGKDWWCVAIDGQMGFMSDDYLVKGLHSARDIASENPAGGNAWTGGNPYATVSNPIATQALNLRQYPSVGSQVLDKLYNGEKLWVNEYGSEWCAVTHQDTGVSGYVMTQYVRLHNLSSAATRKVSHPAASYVNLRSAPNMYANNVLLRVPHGAAVTIVSPGTDWCKVQYNGTAGYMMSYFLK